jgi:ATP-dependent helicase HrpA
VIDSGMCKEKSFNASLNMDSLQITRISKSSAIQRKGRVGRTKPGICYRLYSKEDFNLMKPSRDPEILRYCQLSSNNRKFTVI